MALEALWTPQEVQAQLSEAADTLRRLRAKSARPAAYKTNWPDIVQDFWESYGLDDAEARLPAPRPAAIDRMDEVLGWLFHIQDIKARRIIWAKASGIKTAKLARVMGISRYYVDRINRDNLERLTKQLNGSCSFYS